MPKLRVQYEEIHDNLTLQSHSHSINRQLDINMQICLPSYLMPSFWFRHRLTAEHVASILNNALPQNVWLLALGCGCAEPAPSCVKVGFSHLRDILVGSRAAAVRKIIDQFQASFAEVQGQIPRDTFCRDNFHNNQVRHFLTEDNMAFVRNNLLPNFDYFNVTRVQSLFDFGNQKWISIQFDQNAILAVRVTPYHEYNSSLRDKIDPRRSVIRCVDAKHGNQDYVLLLDEIITFMSGFVNQRV